MLAEFPIATDFGVVTGPTHRPELSPRIRDPITQAFKLNTGEQHVTN